MVFRQLPLEMALEKTLAAGYDALELWPPQISECRTPELRHQLASRIAIRGVELIRLNCADRDYFQSLGSRSDLQDSLSGLQTDIDFAADLGMSQLLTWKAAGARTTLTRTSTGGYSTRPPICFNKRAAMVVTVASV